MSHSHDRERSRRGSPGTGGETVTSDAALALVLEGRSASEAGRDVECQLVGLMDQYEHSIYNFLLSLVRNGDIALDCTQDTFLRAYENLLKNRPVNAPWLYKVARNRAMDEFRRQKRVQPELEKLEQIPVYLKTDETLSVQSVMEKLSTTDRELLYLFDIAGFKTDEIGTMLGVRGSAIRQRLTRARERFRRLYGEKI